jgi:hypothetical protein
MRYAFFVRKFKIIFRDLKITVWVLLGITSITHTLSKNYFEFVHKEGIAYEAVKLESKCSGSNNYGTIYRRSNQS